MEIDEQENTYFLNTLSINLLNFFHIHILTNLLDPLMLSILPKTYVSGTCCVEFDFSTFYQSKTNTINKLTIAPDCLLKQNLGSVSGSGVKV